MECKRGLSSLSASSDAAGLSRKRTKLGEELNFEPLIHERTPKFFNVKDTRTMTAAPLRRRRHLSRKRTAATISQTSPAAPSGMILSPKQNFRDYTEEDVLAEHKPNEWPHKKFTKVGLETAEKCVGNMATVVPVSAKPKTVDETPRCGICVVLKPVYGPLHVEAYSLIRLVLCRHCHVPSCSKNP